MLWCFLCCIMNKLKICLMLLFFPASLRATYCIPFHLNKNKRKLSFSDHPFFLFGIISKKKHDDAFSSRVSVWFLQVIRSLWLIADFLSLSFVILSSLRRQITFVITLHFSFCMINILACKLFHKVICVCSKWKSLMRKTRVRKDKHMHIWVYTKLMNRVKKWTSCIVCTSLMQWVGSKIPSHGSHTVWKIEKKPGKI